MTHTEADLCPSRPRTELWVWNSDWNSWCGRFPQPCWGKELLDGNSELFATRLLSQPWFCVFVFFLFYLSRQTVWEREQILSEPVLTKIHQIQTCYTAGVNTPHTHTEMISKLHSGWFYCQSNSQRLFWETTSLFGLAGAVGLWNKFLFFIPQRHYRGAVTRDKSVAKENFTLWFEIYCPDSL